MQLPIAAAASRLHQAELPPDQVSLLHSCFSHPSSCLTSYGHAELSNTLIHPVIPLFTALQWLAITLRSKYKMVHDLVQATAVITVLPPIWPHRISLGEGSPGPLHELSLFLGENDPFCPTLPCLANSLLTSQLLKWTSLPPRKLPLCHPALGSVLLFSTPTGFCAYCL